MSGEDNDGPPLVGAASRDLGPNEVHAASSNIRMKIHLIGNFHGVTKPYTPAGAAKGFIRDKERNLVVQFELKISIPDALEFPFTQMAKNCVDIPLAYSTSSGNFEDDSAIIFLYSSVLARLISPQRLMIELEFENINDAPTDFMERFVLGHMDYCSGLPLNLFNFNFSSPGRDDSVACLGGFFSRTRRAGKNLWEFFSKVYNYLDGFFSGDVGMATILDDYVDSKRREAEQWVRKIEIKVPHAYLDSYGSNVLRDLRQFTKALNRNYSTKWKDQEMLKHSVWKYVISVKIAQDSVRSSGGTVPSALQELFMWSTLVCQEMFMCAFPPPPRPRAFYAHTQPLWNPLD